MKTKLKISWLTPCLDSLLSEKFHKPINFLTGNDELIYWKMLWLPSFERLWYNFELIDE